MSAHAAVPCRIAAIRVRSSARSSAATPLPGTAWPSQALIDKHDPREESPMTPFFATAAVAFVFAFVAFGIADAAPALLSYVN